MHFSVASGERDLITKKRLSFRYTTKTLLHSRSYSNSPQVSAWFYCMYWAYIVWEFCEVQDELLDQVIAGMSKPLAWLMWVWEGTLFKRMLGWQKFRYTRHYGDQTFALAMYLRKFLSEVIEDMVIRLDPSGLSCTSSFSSTASSSTTKSCAATGVD